jgi:hypothetical protein
VLLRLLPHHLGHRHLPVLLHFHHLLALHLVCCHLPGLLLYCHRRLRLYLYLLDILS